LRFCGYKQGYFVRWLQESEEDDAKPILKDLSDTVRKARAQAEMRNVLRIQKAADDSWQAAAWWLERSQPKKWSKQTNVELSGVNGNPINVALDTRAALLELLTPKPDLED
jgi:hypothetical protein